MPTSPHDARVTVDVTPEDDQICVNTIPVERAALSEALDRAAAGRRVVVDFTVHRPARLEPHHLNPVRFALAVVRGLNGQMGVHYRVM
jgi:hypothetical protein